MRTAPVGLAFLGDRELTAQAARDIAALTHTDPMVGDTCVIWTEAVRLAVTEGVIDPYAGLDLLHPDVRESMAQTLSEAEAPNFHLSSNSFTVTSMQAAWHAVSMARDSDDPVSQGITLAIAQGSDTDTTAAIAGALLGAAFGDRAVPTYPIHGWPGYQGEDLARLGEAIAGNSYPEPA